MTPSRVVITLAAAVALIAGSAEAACTERSEARDLKRSLSLAAKCNDKTLKSGPITCKEAPPPACAGTMRVDAIALAYGPNDPASAAVDRSVLSDQLRCQKRIGRGVVGYVGRKLRSLQKGKDAAAAETSARKKLDRLVKRCDVPVAQDPSGVVLPAVGPQCAAAVGDPGAQVDAPLLADCLATLLGTWVDRWGPDPQPLRPNILFLFTDDQRWDSTDGIHSPTGAFIMPRTRAELTDQGVQFPDAFITTPVCCPARASTLAGSYAHRTGVYRNQGTNGGADDFEDASSLATWLQAAGYRTSLIGKYLNGYAGLWDRSIGEPPYVPPGWTEWRGLRRVSFFNYIFVEPNGLGGYAEVQYGSAPEDYLTDVMREKAKTFMSESVAAGEPFFLYLSFKAPHLPQIPAPRHEGSFQHFPPWRPPSWNEADVSDKPAWVQATPEMTPEEQADIDQIRIDQLEMLRAVDEAIGGSEEYGIVGIMEHLRNLGVADDTIVVYLSDNGWQWGEHRMRAKNKPYEESIRSPMFVRYPKLAPLPRTEPGFALNIDLGPTFAELAGVGVPIAHDGESLVNLLDGTAPAGTWRSDFLTEGWPGDHPWATVREAQWKYTEIPVTPGDPNTLFETELYDLWSDPYELENVASDPVNAVRVAEMALRLRQLRPNWPVDSDAGGPDLPEDPNDD